MATKTTTSNFARLKTEYNDSADKMLKELGLKNKHELPKLQKIVINVGLGRAKDDKKILEIATNTIKKITGQTPIETIAKNSIAGFKLREGNKIGLKVTLRDNKMYEFMDRLINIVMPRLRDFHGVSNKSFDSSGNFSVGLVDQSVFPELTFEETTTPHGLQVIFVIDSKSKEHSKALLESFGMPFEKVHEPRKAPSVSAPSPAPITDFSSSDVSEDTPSSDKITAGTPEDEPEKQESSSDSSKENK